MFVKNLNKNLRFSVLALLMLILIGSALLYPAQHGAQKYWGRPVQKAMLIKVVRTRAKTVPEIVKTIKDHGVNFQLTSATEGELLAARAKPQIIEAVRNNYRTAEVAAVRRNTGGSMAANTNIMATNTVASQTSDEDDQEERYDDLYFDALDAFSQMQTATDREQANGFAKQLVDIAFKLFEIDDSRPEAYKLTGSAAMVRGKYALAEEYGQKAIDRGGSLGFNVWHLSGAPHPEVLHVGKNYITVESNQKFFEFNSSHIMQVAPQGYYNLPNGSSVPVLGIATSKDGRNDAWYFAGATGNVDELQMIMRLIKKNASGGR